MALGESRMSPPPHAPTPLGGLAQTSRFRARGSPAGGRAPRCRTPVEMGVRETLTTEKPGKSGEKGRKQPGNNRGTTRQQDRCWRLRTQKVFYLRSPLLVSGATPRSEPVAVTTRLRGSAGCPAHLQRSAVGRMIFDMWGRARAGRTNMLQAAKRLVRHGWKLWGIVDNGKAGYLCFRPPVSGRYVLVHARTGHVRCAR